VVEAIDQEDDQALEEELGDLLLQVVFHCELAAEDARWNLQDVADRISDKLIARHPHVFESRPDDLDTSASLKRWEELKSKEKPEGSSAIAGVPLALPALTASEKLQSRAARVGFEWPTWEGALLKLEEELGEMRDALHSGSSAEIQHELGDVLTAVVNIARFRQIDPEQALRDANARFVKRFQEMERISGGSLSDKDLDEMLALWIQAKKRLY
jgi:MazG family protein